MLWRCIVNAHFCKLIMVILGKEQVFFEDKNKHVFVNCLFIYYTALASETKLVVSFTHFPVTLCLFVFSSTWHSILKQKDEPWFWTGTFKKLEMIVYKTHCRLWCFEMIIFFFLLNSNSLTPIKQAAYPDNICTL